MSKHTPGPWILSETEVYRYGEVVPTKICEIFCSNNNKVICEIPDYRYHAEYDVSDAADARLITAAPDLLEALEACIDYGVITGAEWVIEKAQHALIKARGES